jgi:hypothetical protein
MNLVLQPDFVPSMGRDPVATELANPPFRRPPNELPEGPALNRSRSSPPDQRRLGTVSAVRALVTPAMSTCVPGGRSSVSLYLLG